MGTEATNIDLEGYVSDSGAALAALVQIFPCSLAVREAMRMRALAASGPLETPLLDVGCGNGLFWEILARSAQAHESDLLRGLVGIDIDHDELELASVRLASRGASFEAVDITGSLEHRLPSTLEGSFATAIANCSLEHVIDLEEALRNVKRLLRPGGTFILFVPALRWPYSMAVTRALERISPRFAGLYAGLFDGFFQHNHLYPAYVWAHLLQGVGYRDVEVLGLGSRESNRLFERWLPLAFLSFLFKGIFKRYPRVRAKERLDRHFARFRDETVNGAFIHEDLTHPEIVELYVRCRV